MFKTGKQLLYKLSAELVEIENRLRRTKLERVTFTNYSPNRTTGMMESVNLVQEWIFKWAVSWENGNDKKITEIERE